VLSTAQLAKPVTAAKTLWTTASSVRVAKFDVDALIFAQSAPLVILTAATPRLTLAQNARDQPDAGGRMSVSDVGQDRISRQMKTIAHWRLRGAPHAEGELRLLWYALLVCGAMVMQATTALCVLERHAAAAPLSAPNAK